MNDNIEEAIKQFLKELTEAKKELEQKFRLVSGCKTNGIVELDLHNICSDKECINCRRFEKAFRDEANSWRTKQEKINLNKI